jgi:pimeloyl-ACP methyl ester carboxylesterase
MTAASSCRGLIRVTIVSLLSLAALTSHAGAQSHVAGQTGPGSFYEIDVPALWNGDLVIYAHGIVQADEPLVPPTQQFGYPVVHAALLAAGYAVAASSFSSNGWSLDDAVRRTHQLRGLFVSKVGQPHRTLLVGHSLGGLAIVKLAETHASQYDGVLAMCAPVGGALAELQYAGDARVTFDYYFPGLLPGEPFAVPEGAVFLSPFDPGGPSPLFLSVAAAFAANPDKLAQWALAAKLPYASPDELVSSALYVVGFVLRYTNDFVERVNGKIPYDNSGTVYQVTVSPDPLVNAFLSAQLNAGVERFEAAPAAQNYYTRNYQPTGDIGIPVLTLHNTRDPAIPFAHEAVFADLVAAAGRSDLLVQRTADRWGHCNFLLAEMQGAFAELAFWVATGIRP